MSATTIGHPAFKDAIRNPANADHLMVLQPVDRPVEIQLAGRTIARTTQAIRLVEIGRGVYPPRIYLPLADATVPLETVDKSTHCPLKGDAVYHAVDGVEVGWSYKSLDFAAAIDGLISFDGPTIRMIEDESTED
ncbi:DUF427 domain-containing protein [Maricaulis maris]|uniref:DUF427 domain-containing protein n=1 Tax=Maricaulis maris TaxID=74318 RepID=UPI003B8AD7FD